MKCVKCKKENITKANYCKTCGSQFSKEEQEKARKKTLVGKIERLEKAYNLCTLKAITGSTIFKVISLLIVLLIGLYFLFNFGNKVKLLESPEYKIEYNTKLKEYYLLVKNDEVDLNLFVPNKIDNLGVKIVNKNNQEISRTEYEKNDEIKLFANGEDYYYLIDDNKVDDILKIFVYRTME